MRNIKETYETPNPEEFSNVGFSQTLDKKSNPLKDKINSSLLKDIEQAAKKSNIKVGITTAITGHHPGTRHESGNAVDISIINGKRFSSESDAKNKGIFDEIKSFVSELEKMGYVKNSEKGNDKAVLTFGFEGHNNHIHVSRKSDSGSQLINLPTNDKKIQNFDNIELDANISGSSDNSSELTSKDLSDFLTNLSKISPQTESTHQIKEEISRIKSLF